MELYDHLLEFSKELIKKFDGLIRVIALFGSYSKQTQTSKSDIDILIIVDDLYNRWDDLVKTWYLTELKNIIKQEKYSKIHASTITLSIFWDMIRVGDPLAISIIRTGIPILDTFGMFAALKKMLQEGKIKPSQEAIAIIKQRIPLHINHYEFYLLKALESVYWIFVDSAHYLLMSFGKNPPSPENIPRELEKLVNQKVLKKEYSKWYKAIFELIHRISHKEIKSISAETVEEWYLRSLDFKNEVEKLVKKVKNKH